MEYITEGGDMYENCSGKEPEVPVRHSPHDIRHKKRGRITEKGAQGEPPLAVSQDTEYEP